MPTWARRTIVAALVLTSATIVVRRLTYDPAPWIADYEALQHHLSLAYANLEWAVEGRKLDLPALDARTRARLEAAGSDVECSLALAAFIDAFDDGHLRVDREWPSFLWGFLPRSPTVPQAADESGPPPLPWPADTGAAEACDRLGFHDDRRGFSLATEALPGWRSVQADPFPAGRFSLPDGRVAGLLRIPIFDHQRYRDACELTWAARASVPCDSDCQGELRWRQIPITLLRALARTIHELEDIDVMVVDLTGNGGGTDWVDPAARLFSARPLGCPRLSAIIHDHWRGRPTRALAEVDEALATGPAPPDERLLRRARDRLTKWQEELAGSCDLSPLWRGEDPGCSRLTRVPITACGPLSYAPPGALASLAQRGDLFEALGFDYEEGPWSGPLVVLVDRRTASASEHFAAILRDHNAALIVGERTAGAGCGYTGGGVPITLEHSGLTVRVPDCVRWRANGDNELEGVEPDRSLEWSDLKSNARAEALVEALRDPF